MKSIKNIIAISGITYLVLLAIYFYLIFSYIINHSIETLTLHLVLIIVSVFIALVCNILIVQIQKTKKFNNIGSGKELLVGTGFNFKNTIRYILFGAFLYPAYSVLISIFRFDFDMMGFFLYFILGAYFFQMVIGAAVGAIVGFLIDIRKK